MLAGLVEGRSTTNFALALMVKDLNEALALGASTMAPMPMTAAARGIMQAGVNLFGKSAKLDDVIPLTEQLANVKFKGDAKIQANPVEDGAKGQDLLAHIERATIVCNAIAVFECVEMGQEFGLPMEQMARILNVGSAWSVTSEKILPARARNKIPQLGITFGEAYLALTQLTRRAAELGVPLLLPHAALAWLQRAMKANDKGSDLGLIGISFQK